MLGLPAAQENRFVGMELREPEIDIVGVARSLGVQAETITEPDTLSDALHESLAGNKPRLINVPIERAFECK
jgi:thiamine pyrophosphate-dependent acetolactate synthase large subunit-like protein